MNCHSQVLKDDPKLAVVRESYATGTPIHWVQIHKLPDYVYFNHSVHVDRGISCVECHGHINKMDEVYQAKPLTMAFCLDCHRDPAASSALSTKSPISTGKLKVLSNNAFWAKK